MILNDIFQIVLYLTVLVAVGLPLGSYMTRVYSGTAIIAQKAIGPLERFIFKVCQIEASSGMSWQQYAGAVLAFSAVGLISVWLIQRVQNILPLNPQNFGGISSDSALNTAISFVTNTNWQAYGGEVTMSYFSQMIALAVQNFASAATGMAVLVAFIRGFVGQHSGTIGNFWCDLVRSTLYILLPLSIVLSLVLVSQGVIQNFDAYKPAAALDSAVAKRGETVVLPMGPAASQIAIKQLGTNGGGFFNVNSAHPFENPTPLSNFVEMLAVLLIPVGLCFTFGDMVQDRRQGWAIFAAMAAIFVSAVVVCYCSELQVNPQFSSLGLNTMAGNMEGKEVRFGVVNSALWAVVTTAASNGSVNSMHDSFTPIGGLMPLLLMQLGEVVYGGVGSGLYGMLVFAVISVFIAGLMVGRTPEYLGKKIEIFEMKMAAVVILIPPLLVLTGTAIAVSIDQGRSAALNPGAHGFSEILYALSSAGNNNGSAFAGLSANVPFYNYFLGICMWISRFWLVVPILAMAGALATKKRVPSGLGTLPTHTPLFVILLVGVVLIFGALTFVPALALGPLVEHLQMVSTK